MHKAVLLVAALCAQACAQFQAGAARRDITPREPVPMWGYGARHDALSNGVLDPLYADALVLSAGGTKLAIVGLDLGRSPAEASLQRIRKRIKDEAGIEYSILAGSHTHNGPVLELTDQPGKGKGRFDAAIRYYTLMEDSIVAAIVEANGRLRPARIAGGSVRLNGFNRNRQTRLEPKPTDPELSVIRIDGEDDKPLAVLLNFAAHPTTIPASTLKFSADWVGAMRNQVAKETGAAPLFLQGAAGDQSAVLSAGQDYQAFGQAIGREAAKVALALEPRPPSRPSIAVHEERFRFASRTDFTNPLVKMMFSQAFFPELIPNYIDEYSDGIRPRLTVAVLNGDTGIAAVSGEFFSSHAVRLKERARMKQLIFAGYANGYHQYFPTIEAASEGGYGADSRVSPVQVGAGEEMMDSALLWLYRLRGLLK